jgi:hypothetical protein
VRLTIASVAYRVIVMYDGNVVMDTTADLEQWPGFDEGLPGNISVALNAKNQEAPSRALLQRALNEVVVSEGEAATLAALKHNLESLMPRPESPVLCFSYDDPGPRKPDGSPVRTNIERVIEPGMGMPISVSADPGSPPNTPPHEYIVVVEEVA